MPIKENILYIIMSRRYKYNTLILENGRNVYIGAQTKNVHILFSNGETDYKICNRRWLEKRVVKEYYFSDMPRISIKKRHISKSLLSREVFNDIN